MIFYQHTQAGTLLRSIFGGCIVLSAAIALVLARVEPAAAFIPILAATILAIALLLFHSLTVKVSHAEIALSFGIGMIRKRFATADVAGAAAVRNRWYYGWGVRLTPHGWLFNVSGLDAVELELENGRTYRIGTDQPVELLHAIESVTGS